MLTEPTSSRSADALVPVLNRGAAITLTADPNAPPSVEPTGEPDPDDDDETPPRPTIPDHPPARVKIRMLTIATGLNFVPRLELFELGQIVRVPTDETDAKGDTIVLEEWRAAPGCPAFMRGQLEIVDPCSSSDDGALAVVKASTSAAALEQWLAIEPRPLIQVALRRRIRITQVA